MGFFDGDGGGGLGGLITGKIIKDLARIRRAKDVSDILTGRQEERRKREKAAREKKEREEREREKAAKAQKAQQTQQASARSGALSRGVTQAGKGVPPSARGTPPPTTIGGLDASTVTKLASDIGQARIDKQRREEALKQQGQQVVAVPVPQSTPQATPTQQGPDLSPLVSEQLRDIVAFARAARVSLDELNSARGRKFISPFIQQLRSRRGFGA